MDDREKQVLFLKKLRETKAKADENGKFITEAELEKAFADLDLDGAQQKQVKDYLKSSGIGIGEALSFEEVSTQEERDYLAEYETMIGTIELPSDNVLDAVRLSAMADGSYRISGKCVLGAVQPDRTVTVPGAATLLLRFREQVEESGRVFTRIRAIRSGFLLQPSAYSSELFPVWRIETDGGTWCVSAEDGKLLSELT